MTDKRFLELEITEWLHSSERKKQLAGEHYYHGDQEAAHRRRLALDEDGKPIELKHLPNNRLVNNLYAKMVDQKTNYSFGRPFSFDTDNKEYEEALSTVFGQRFCRTLRNVGEGAIIGGKSWLYPYYNGGELCFKRFPADEVLAFWADADHTILDAAVHAYVVLEYDESEHIKEVVKVEVLHGGGVDCFIRHDDGTLRWYAVTVYEAVVLRLAMLGYEVTDNDKTGLEYLINKCEKDILANINQKLLPDGLFYTLVDMVAGHFMYNKKAAGALEGFDFEAPAKSITEGDISVTFAGASDGAQSAEARFDALLATLMHPAESTLAAYRRMRW